MKIKLLAFDIDGTILASNCHLMPEDTKNAIKSAHNHGYHILISTGRCPYFIPNDIKDNLSYDYLVTINGSLITNAKEEVLVSHFLSKEIVGELKQLALKYDVAFAFKFEKAVVVYHKYQEFINNYTNGVEYPDILIDNSQVRDYDLQNNAYGCFIVADNDILAKIRSEYPKVKWSWCYDRAMECYPLEVSKLSGIDYVLRQYHLTRDELMAFGDGENDIEMLNYAAIGVAVGNAQPKLKEVANYISDDCDKGGIAKALKYFKII